MLAPLQLAAILGAMLAHLGAGWAHLEPACGHLGGNVGPSWGYGGRILGLCWPILGVGPACGPCSREFSRVGGTERRECRTAVPRPPGLWAPGWI